MRSRETLGPGPLRFRLNSGGQSPVWVDHLMMSFWLPLAPGPPWCWRVTKLLIVPCWKMSYHPPTWTAGAVTSGALASAL